MAKTNKPSLLVVDDDELILELLIEEFDGEYDVVGAGTRTEVSQALKQINNSPDYALVDLGLPPATNSPREGLALIKELQVKTPHCAIIVISGQNEEEHARIARTLGAIDYIAKPCNADEIRLALEKAKNTISVSSNIDGLQGSSPAINRLLQQIKQFGKVPHPVLIEGESGTGKELVARALHRSSGLAGNFIAINCAAIPEQLFEASLFGAKKGSYTGAIADSKGHIVEAEGGSLFLDEIGDMAIDTQPKLLRVLESGEYYRIGDAKPSIANVRIIAATNQSLAEKINLNSFREDLYHRLSVLSIKTPALRHLGDDRNLLLDNFRQAAANNANEAKFKLSSEAVKIWNLYDFPGNVRELRNIIFRLQVLYPGKTVSQEELSKEFLHDPSKQVLGKDLKTLLAEDTKKHIQAAIKECGGEVKAAKQLGINIDKLTKILDDS